VGIPGALRPVKWTLEMLQQTAEVNQDSIQSPADRVRVDFELARVHTYFAGNLILIIRNFGFQGMKKNGWRRILSRWKSHFGV
jgi:hypothetical protein